MTRVDSRVSFAAEDLGDGRSDTARVTIRSNFGKDDNIDTGVRHTIVDKMVIGIVRQG